MKGDFSRQTFDPKKHYTGVWMQQGRVQVDADWNEQQAIHQYRFETEATDVIGSSGTPIHDPDTDFKITVESDKDDKDNKGKRYLQIGRGRYYVHGLLCQNHEDIPYNQQMYLSEHQRFPEVLASKEKTTILALLYLDVWQRHVTALDDPHIRDVALGGPGGPDTTTRTQIAWQVRALPLALPTDVQDRAETLERLLGQPRNAQVDHEIERYRADIHEYWRKTTCNSSFPEWEELVAPHLGTLKARTHSAGGESSHLVSPAAGYQLLENQLYRVEVHHGSNRKDGPTFKWSRDNGSVLTLVEAIKDNNVTVQDVGSDDTLGFGVDQWVELVDDLTEMEGRPGQLLRIVQVNSVTRTITLDGTPRKIDMKWKPKVRRWDQTGNTATEHGVAATEHSVTVTEHDVHGGHVSTNWLPLEGGIEVHFSTGKYKTGDYWLIPARTATGRIEWPTEGPGAEPAAQAPLGVQHYYSRLALVMVDLYEDTIHVQDCRKRFASLSSTAMHVLKTSWANDGVLPLTEFIERGLTIRLDAVPDSRSVKAAAVVVMLEVLELVGLDEGKLPHSSTTLTGTTRIEDNAIHWRWLHGTERRLVDWLSRLLNELRIPTIIRVRVTLKGHAIWSNQQGQQLYLDGQSFGYAVERSEHEKRFAALGNHHERIELVGTNRTELHYPSGNGARASDFESWFYLAQ